MTLTPLSGLRKPIRKNPFSQWVRGLMAPRNPIVNDPKRMANSSSLYAILSRHRLRNDIKYFLLLFWFMGHKSEPNVQTYAYCRVDRIEWQPDGKELTYCSEGGRIYFNRDVKLGEGVYYVPFTEDDSKDIPHGYVKSIDDPL